MSTDPTTAINPRDVLYTVLRDLIGHREAARLIAANDASVRAEEKATAAAATATSGADPLIVDRFDTAMEPAPEDPPGLIVGAIAADGQPVALFFDAEDRAKVAAWLAPGPVDSSRERRLEQLLDTIRTHGGQWNTGRVQDMRRRKGRTTKRSTARLDLAELCRRGHLDEHGPENDRYYALARKADRDA